MPIDWGFAAKVGGAGFGTVFLVLMILAGAIWVVGKAVSRLGSGSKDPPKKGA